MGTNSNTREDLGHIRIIALGTKNKGGFPLKPNVTGKGLDKEETYLVCQHLLPEFMSTKEIWVLLSCY